MKQFYLAIILSIIAIIPLKSQINFCGNWSPSTVIFTISNYGCTEIHCEDFETYAHNTPISPRPNWLLFPAPAAVEAYVQFVGDPVANDKKLHIDGGASVGQTDVLFQLGNKTSGQYYLDFNLRLEFFPYGNQVAYYNLRDEQNGGNIQFEIYLYNGGGTVRKRLSGGGSNDFQFSYTNNRDISISHVFNLNNNSTEFYIDGSLIHSWPYQTNTAGSNRLGSVNFYGNQFSVSGNQRISNYLIDNIYYCEENAPPPAFDCSDSQPILCGEYVFEDNFSGDNYFGLGTYPCHENPPSGTTYSGSERVYDFEVECNGDKEIEIFLTGLNRDLDIFLFSGCPENGGVCIGSGTNNDTDSELIREDLSPGTYYLVVDSYIAGVGSDFELFVNGNCSGSASNCTHCSQPLNDLPNGTVLQCESFDSRQTTGISTQSCEFKLWNPTFSDGNVITNPFGSGRVLEIKERATGAQTDLLYELGNKTSNRYRLEWSMYVRSNKSGYYNLQHGTSGSNPNWGAHFFYEPDGTGYFRVGTSNDRTSFQYNNGDWNDIVHIFDITNNIAELWVNSNFVGSWEFDDGTRNGTTTTRSDNLGSINFFANTNTDYLIDNICYWQKACGGTVFTSTTSTTDQLCVDNGEIYLSEADARCALYTSSEWEICQSICESEGTFIQTGDRFSAKLDFFELAPTMLLSEPCIVADFGGILPDSTLAEIFIFDHPEQDDIGFNTIDLQGNRGYLFSCECTDIDCETTEQNCLGNIETTGTFFNQPPGLYYLAIIGTERDSFGFNIIPESRYCDTDINDFECGRTLQGDLRTEGNDFSTSSQLNPYRQCYSGFKTFEGGDIVYALTIESQQSVSFNLEASEEVGLFLFNFLCGQECINARVTPRTGGRVEMNDILLDKGVYYLIVDKAEDSGDGNFQLTTSCISGGLTNIFLNQSDTTACPLDSSIVHRIDLQKKSNSILNNAPLINFYYPSATTNLPASIDGFAQEHNGDDVMALPILGDLSGDLDKCSFVEDDPIIIAIGNPNSNTGAAFYEPVYEGAGGGANSDDGLFSPNGVSVITKLSKRDILSYSLSLSRNIETNSSQQEREGRFTPSFMWTFDIPSTSTWLDMDVKLENAPPYPATGRTLTISLEENTSFRPREATINIRSLDLVETRIPITIVQNGICDLSSLSLSSTNTTICQGEEVTLSINEIGPDLSDVFDLLWSDNSTGFDNSDQPMVNTTYSVTVTNKVCNEVRVLTQEIIVNSAPNTPVKDKDEVVCEGEAFPTLRVTAESGVEVNWYNSETSTQILPNGANTLFYVPTMPGEFFAEAVKNQTGCNRSPREKIVLTQVPMPTASILNNAIENVCEGETLQLNGSIGGSGTQYSWSATSGSFNNPNILNPIYTPPIGTNNTATITLQSISSSSECPPETAQIQINILSAPDAPSKIMDEVVCEGEIFPTLRVTAESGVEVNWYSSETSTQILPNGANTLFYVPMGPGEFFAEAVKNQTGCNRSPREKIVLTQVLKPTASINNNAIENVCEGETLQLNGSIGGSGTQYSWSATSGSFNNPNILNPIYIPPSVAINDVVITLQSISSSSECPPEIAQILVNVSPIPNIAAVINTNQSYCSNEQPPVLEVNVFNSSVNWYDSNTSNNPLAGGINTTSFRPPGPGIYFAEASNLSNDDCKSSNRIQFTVTERQQPTVEAGNYPPICEGTLINLQGIVPDQNVDVLWTSGLGNFQNNDRRNATFIPPSGISSVVLTLTATDRAGICDAVSDNVSISIEEQPRASILTNDNFICAGSQLPLQGQLSGTNSGIWSLSSSLGTISSPTQINNAQFNSQQGTEGNVKIYLTTNASGICQDFRDSIEVRIQENVIVDAGIAQTVCEGEPIELSGSITGSVQQGTWSAPDISGGFFDPSSNQLTTKYFPPAGIRSVLLNLESIKPAGPCPIESDGVMITIEPSPQILSADTTCSADLNSYDYEFMVSSNSMPTNPSHGTLVNLGNNRWTVNNIPSDQIFSVSIRNGNSPFCESEIIISNPNCECASILAPPPSNNFEYCDGESIPELNVNSLSNLGLLGNWYENENSTQPLPNGERTNTYLPTGPGVFFVETIDPVTGCTSPDRSRIILIRRNLPVVELGDEVNVCPFTSVEIEAQGDNNLSYLWNDGTTGKRITITPEPEEVISLSITVNDGNCSNTDDLIVRGFDDVAADIVIQEEIECNGGSNGELLVQITSGLSPFQYNWSNGLVTDEIKGISSGDYSVTVTDFNKCSDTAFVSLTEPDLIEISNIVSAPHLDNGLGSISIDVMGGTPPYEFNWEKDGIPISNNNEDPTGLEMGTYRVLIIDDNGCEFRSGEIVVDRVSSLNQVEFSNSIQIFPNPTSGELFVKIDSPELIDLEFQLIDPLGRFIRISDQTRISNEMIRLNLNSQASGIYFIKVKSQKGEAVKRVIIE